ncbi:uncharacterized protein K452DRAFT_356205, partial [Aplosporella prunicola CBS 121167]
MDPKPHVPVIDRGVQTLGPEDEHSGGALNTRISIEESAEYPSIDDASIAKTRSCSPKWIQAEQGHPDDNASPGALRQPHTRSSKVIVYDSEKEKLYVKSLDEVRNYRAIVFRLPSHRSKAVHVYIGSVTEVGLSANYRARITTKKRFFDGLQYYQTIRLDRLSCQRKLQLLFGQIKW